MKSRSLKLKLTALGCWHWNELFEDFWFCGTLLFLTFLSFSLFPYFAGTLCGLGTPSLALLYLAERHWLVKRSRTRDNNVFQPLAEEYRHWTSGICFKFFLLVSQLLNFCLSLIHLIKRKWRLRVGTQVSTFLLCSIFTVRRTRKKGLSEDERDYLIALAAQVAAAWFTRLIFLFFNFFGGSSSVWLPVENLRQSNVCLCVYVSSLLSVILLSTFVIFWGPCSVSW